MGERFFTDLQTGQKITIFFIVMKRNIIIFFVILLSPLLCGAGESIDDYLITADQLVPLLGKPDIIVIDVRTKYDWDNSKVKIKGAVHEEGMKFGSWMNKYPKNKKIVLYCD